MQLKKQWTNLKIDDRMSYIVIINYIYMHYSKYPTCSSSNQRRTVHCRTWDSPTRNFIFPSKYKHRNKKLWTRDESFADLTHIKYLPCNSGPTTVISADNNLPMLRCRSSWKGGALNSSFNARLRVDSTWPRNIGPEASASTERAWRDHTCEKNAIATI